MIPIGIRVRWIYPCCHSQIWPCVSVLSQVQRTVEVFVLDCLSLDRLYYAIRFCGACLVFHITPALCHCLRHVVNHGIRTKYGTLLEPCIHFYQRHSPGLCRYSSWSEVYDVFFGWWYICVHMNMLLEPTTQLYSSLWKRMDVLEDIPSGSLEKELPLSLELGDRPASKQWYAWNKSLVRSIYLIAFWSKQRYHVRSRLVTRSR